MKNQLIRIIISFLLIIISFLIKFDNELYNNIFYIIAYIIVGYDVVLKAMKHIFKGKVFDEHFLMTVATIGAFCINEFPEAVAVMLFYQIGELFQSYAVDKSRKSIVSLMDIRPDYANVYRETKIEKIDPNEVNIGEIIYILSMSSYIPDCLALFNLSIASNKYKFTETDEANLNYSYLRWKDIKELLIAFFSYHLINAMILIYLKSFN